MEEKKPFTAEEKVRQVQDASGAGSAIDDIAIIDPAPEIFTIGTKDTASFREYHIRPLPLSKQRLLRRLSELKMADDDATMDEVIRTISEILNEPDKKFIADNFTSADCLNLFSIIQRNEFRSIRKLFDLSKKKPENPDR